MNTVKDITIADKRAKRRQSGLLSDTDKTRVLAYYMTTDRSLQDICKELNVNLTSIYNTSSREGWEELRVEYRNSNLARLTDGVTSADIDKIKLMRQKDCKEWQRLQDRVIETIDNLLDYNRVAEQAEQDYSSMSDQERIDTGAKGLREFVSAQYLSRLSEGRVLTASSADRYINALFKAQQGKYRALGLADTVNINVDMQAIAPQGVLNMVRNDSPDWLKDKHITNAEYSHIEQGKPVISARQTEQLEKTDTSLDECQAFQSTTEVHRGGGMGQNDPLPPADSQPLSPCSTTFSEPDKSDSSDITPLSPELCRPTTPQSAHINFEEGGLDG